MINVSNEFKRLMNERTDFTENAVITFLDGKVLELSENDFTITNNSLVDGASSNGIPLGVAVCRSVKIELMNDDDRFSDYDFFGAIIRLYLTFKLSETIERIEYGTFTVLTPETYGTTVIITALDDMHKADKEYDTDLTFPATIGEIYMDACQKIGIQPGTVTFLNDDFIVNEKPTDITYRQLFGYISMIAAGNARIDTTGRMRIITYDFGILDNIRGVTDGGNFNPWNNPVDLDGGDFSYNTGDVLDGGNFKDSNKYHILGNWKNLKIDTDDIVITGVTIEYEDDNDEKISYVYGEEGYLLKIENPLIAGQEKEAIDLIGSVMVGGRFRQFSGDLVSNPTCEFMDAVALIDRKANTYTSFITDVNFQFFGFTTIKNSATPTLRNGAKTYSQTVKTLVSARKMIEKEKAARELAVERLANDLSKSSGLYMTNDKQEDGSYIYYMHDKPTLAESMIIWKLTALAFGISTDGGKTYPYGFTVDGETITKLLYAEGIDADYINAGSLSADRIKGGTLELGGTNNLNGVIIIIDSHGEEIGKWDKDGVVINKGTIRGSSIVLGNKDDEDGILQLFGPEGTSYVSLSANRGIFAQKGYLGGFSIENGLVGHSAKFLSTNGITGDEALEILNGALRGYEYNGYLQRFSIAYEDSAGYSSLSLWNSDQTVNAFLTPDRLYLYEGNIYAKSLFVSETKSRVASTLNYSDRLLYCYETPSPYFGDIGEGVTDENGMCYIQLDDIFYETVNSNCEYQVFLQKYAQGELWVKKRTPTYFLVKGTPNLKFGWEIKAKQKGYEYERMEKHEVKEKEETINYESEADLYIKNYYKELINYEESN